MYEYEYNRMPQNPRFNVLITYVRSPFFPAFRDPKFSLDNSTQYKSLIITAKKPQVSSDKSPHIDQFPSFLQFIHIHSLAHWLQRRNSNKTTAQRHS
jgi:hypothetical protein